ncbi:MAG: hypothetical protein ACJAT1_001778 [Marivirga sp.]|jgi:hypothetical protein
MKDVKMLRLIYWVLFVGTALMFLYSVRYSPEYRWYTTSAALVFWLLTMLLNRYIKKLKKQSEEETD